MHLLADLAFPVVHAGFGTSTSDSGPASRTRSSSGTRIGPTPPMFFLGERRREHLVVATATRGEFADPKYAVRLSAAEQARAFEAEALHGGKSAARAHALTTRNLEFGLVSVMFRGYHRTYVRCARRSRSGGGQGVCVGAVARSGAVVPGRRAGRVLEGAGGAPLRRERRLGGRGFCERGGVAAVLVRTCRTARRCRRSRSGGGFPHLPETGCVRGAARSHVSMRA